jgi:nitroreductase
MTGKNIQLNSAIKNRWSPGAFSKETVTDEMLHLLFEASRWAPSSRNEQPWNYYYARRENEDEFAQFVDCLIEKNQKWAKHAPVLMVSVMQKYFAYKNLPNGKALHDIGAANVSMAIQAAEMGMQVHQMGGFDKEKAVALLRIDTELFEPVTFMAVGFPEIPEQMDDELIKRELQHNTRKKQSSFVFRIGGGK